MSSEATPNVQRSTSNVQGLHAGDGAGGEELALDFPGRRSRPVSGAAAPSAEGGGGDSGNIPRAWRWRILPELVAKAFRAVPSEPVPVWAKAHVFLDRKVTTRPGYYDVDETPWTYEFQDMIRTRRNPWTGEQVTRISVLKSSVTGYTEGALNGVRWTCANDPQNIIFAIDSAKEAGTINEVRLRPTLERLGPDIFTGKDDDASKFLLNLKRNLIYFLGSYSDAAFANKMCELAIADELEHHGNPGTVEDLESRLKSAIRPLLVLLSKPEFVGGQIDVQFQNGTRHVYEVPCPHCSQAAQRRSTSNIQHPTSNIQVQCIRGADVGAEGAAGASLALGRVVGGGAELGLSADGTLDGRTISAPLRFGVPRGGASASREEKDVGELEVVVTGRGEVLSGFQQLLLENLVFDHWKDAVTGDWDFSPGTGDPFFRCVHCQGVITEDYKRWFNHLERRRWRQTNPNPEPGHVSFHISDFYGYHPDSQWRKLAVKYIKSKGDPVKRKAFRTHHEGLPYEQRATKTEAEDILLLRGTHQVGTLPWKARVIILGADVGLNYVKWAAVAFRDGGNGEAAIVDYGEVNQPKQLRAIMEGRRYRRVDAEGKERFAKMMLGVVDAKYHKEDVNMACLYPFKTPGMELRPCAGISAKLDASSISLNRVDGFPRGFRCLVFVDRDAKSDLYESRITEWVEWERHTKNLPQSDPKRVAPEAPRLWFPAELQARDPFVLEHTNERLVELTSKDIKWLPHAAKIYEWKRKGPNHWGDAVKNALTRFRALRLADEGLLEVE